MMRILVIEDDERGASYLSRALSESGHVVDIAGDGPLGLAMALEGIYQLLLVDRRLPGLDGIELVRRLRQRDPRTPVLMLSAQAATVDRVSGIQAGCDDYLAKPYATSELLARIEALVRRDDRARHAQRLRVGVLELDVASRGAWLRGVALAIQPREFLLLEYMMRHADQVVTRAMLLEAVWKYDFDPRGAVVDTHVHRLRRKLGEDGGSLIRTLPGVGYMLVGVTADG